MDMIDHRSSATWSLQELDGRPAVTERGDRDKLVLSLTVKPMHCIMPQLNSCNNMKVEKGEISIQKHVGHVGIEADLEKALELAGTGRYQVFHCALMVATLSAALLEMIGCSFVLPAAACDLRIPDHMRGILTCIPNIGVIVSAPFWGRAADTLGRKPVLLVSSLAAGFFGLLAAFTPDLLGFALCKLAGSFFLSCPSSLGFAYAGELVPRARRDLAVLVCNGFLTLSAVFTPIIAWGVLSHAPAAALRPWQVLTAVYAAPLLLAALWALWAHESPKFLLARGKPERALEVLRHIHASNTGEQSFCVTRLTNSPEEGEVSSDRNDSGTSILTLLQPPHLKWLALTGFLMFGLFSLLNGLFLFAPDTINKIMSQPTEEGNLCALMQVAENTTSGDTCVDDMSLGALHIMVGTGLAAGLLALVLALGVSRVCKRTLLVALFAAVGATCLLAELAQNRIVAGVAMATMQLTALGVGPLTAFVVHLFPTSLRATAVGAVLMLGRLGSIVGSVVAGTFLVPACAPTVYGFSALLFLCAGLSFLLPSDGTSRNSK